MNRYLLICCLYYQVEALVGRIERIRHSPLNINISESVDEMMACLRRLQSSRKDEINGSITRNKTTITGMRPPDGRGNCGYIFISRFHIHEI